MTTLLYRLWYKCADLPKAAGKRRYRIVVAIVVVLWLSTALISSLITRMSPEGSNDSASMVSFVSLCSGIVLFLMVTGWMLLSVAYSEYRPRLRRYLYGAYGSVGKVDMKPSQPEVTAEVDGEIAQWMTIPLSMERKWALIQAGVKPDKAMTEEVRRLSIEDLRVAAALNEMRPTRPEPIFSQVRKR